MSPVSLRWSQIRYLGAVVGLLSLIACQAPLFPDTPDTSDTSDIVLGWGTIPLSYPLTDLSSQAVTTDVSFSAASPNDGTNLDFSVLASDVVSDSDNNVTYIRTRVAVSNFTGSTLDNLTLLAIAPSSSAVSALANLRDLVNNPLSQTEAFSAQGSSASVVNPLFVPSPTHAFTVTNGQVQLLETQADFVAYDEDAGELDAVVSTLNTIAATNPSFGLSGSQGAGFDLLPYGFQVGTLTSGETGTVDVTFRLPNDANGIGVSPLARFGYVFVAAQDSNGRITQAAEEITLNQNTDTNVSAAETRYNAPSNYNALSNVNTLVLLGSASRDVSVPANNIRCIDDVRIASGVNATVLTSSTTTTHLVGQCDLGANTTTTGNYPVVDTNQTSFYDNGRTAGSISTPTTTSSWFGQDAQYLINPPSYSVMNDVVLDNVTGLMWQRSPDSNGDGSIGADDKLTYSEAVAIASSITTGGYDDWRLPTIKELYSLIDFTGRDPSGYTGTDTSSLTPFIDTDTFEFGYGDTSAGERIIDAQFASSTLYNDVVNNSNLMFGVNFADGRIKGYGLTVAGQEKTFYVLYVRGNPDYGINDFVDNQDGTITDRATGLMWAQDDSGSSGDSIGTLTWQEALEWISTLNQNSYLGYSDWRLPNAKELQSLVDYSRSPESSNSAAINPLFNTTTITNEAGQTDWGYYWSSTTHINNGTVNPAGNAAYVSFGRALGYINNAWIDVHGAGAQRSDPKQGDAANYPTGSGPQGDAVRIDNLARPVRGGY